VYFDIERRKQRNKLVCPDRRRPIVQEQEKKKSCNKEKKKLRAHYNFRSNNMT